MYPLLINFQYDHIPLSCYSTYILNKTHLLYLILKFYEVVLSLSSSHSIGTRVPKNCSPRYSRIIFNASKLIWNQQLILISRLLSHRSNVNPNFAANSFLCKFAREYLFTKNAAIKTDLETTRTQSQLQLKHFYSRFIFWKSVGILHEMEFIKSFKS